MGAAADFERDFAPAAPASAPAPSGPPDLQAGLKSIVQGANNVLGRASAATQQQLEAGGAVDPTIAALVNPVPGSVPGAALMGMSLVAPELKLAGGPVRQAMKMTALGAGTGAVLGGGDALMTGKDPLEGTMQGTFAGGVAGGLAGLGKAWTAWRNKDTIAATSALNSLKREASVSPQVRAALPSSPRALFERETSRQLQDTASKVFDTEIKSIHTASPAPFPLPSIEVPPTTPQAPTKFPSIKGVTMIQQTTGNAVPLVTVETGQKLVAALREVGEDVLARKAELDIVAHLTQQKPVLGSRYQRAVSQYGNDQKLVGTVGALQKMTALPAGGSPVEFPDIAQAVQALGMRKDAKPHEIGALVNGLLGASHPTSFYGAGHLAGALRDISRKGTVNPTKVQASMPSLLQRPGQMGLTLMGARAGAGLAPGTGPPNE